MYFRFVKLFKPFSARLRQVNAKVRRLVDRWLVDRGFFEYFLARRLVFFFLLVLAQERIFSVEEFLQIKMGGMVLLEQA